MLENEANFPERYKNTSLRDSVELAVKPGKALFGLGYFWRPY